MTELNTALPAEVLAALAATVEAVSAEVRQSVRVTEGLRLARIRAEVAGRNGYRYEEPSLGILATAVPGVAVDPHPDGTPEGECDCDACTNDRGCTNDYSCCGYCSDHESHHGDGDDYVTVVPCRRGEHRWCSECQHDCLND